ncbi:Rcs stress response system protein RcsF [Morganella morganii]|uniref:Outer membrane lipoprotein RcsF n=1 Tax=Morganella morganii TaxID=582 RepID=A0A433ZYH3_MORMO|nr:Rcs stress response system protein RcsF [Morganella morganii]RUT67185.1 Rcs stress response system protein RcsF [Morganella morganii]
MRVLIISLLALLIAGCSFRQSHSEQEQVQYADMRLKKPAGKKAKSTSAASRVKLYTHPEELLGKPFRDLGIVLGQNCREAAKSAQSGIPAARKQMLYRAGKLKADAVLLHQCDVTPAQGCKQLAVCEGTAIKVDDV